MDFEIEIQVMANLADLFRDKKNRYIMSEEDEKTITAKAIERLETKFNGSFPKFKYYIINIWDNEAKDWVFAAIESYSDYIKEKTLTSV